nr:transposase [Mesorhizobium sp.]
MAWCEQNRVDYVFGVARNERLVTKIAPAWRKPAGGPRQVVRCTRLWRLSCGRRKTAGHAEDGLWLRPECTTLGANPRFIVSSSSQSAGRHGRFTSTRSHQRPYLRQSLRLWFASFVYVLICALRRLGLAHTRLAEPTCGTIGLKLLKIGARVRVSVRRIKVAMASACHYADEFALAHAEYAPRPDGAAGPETLPANKEDTLHKLKSPHTRGRLRIVFGIGARYRRLARPKHRLTPDAVRKTR